MKKLLYTLLFVVGFFVAAPALSMIGHRGENPTMPQKLQPVNTTKRYGHRGENPNSMNRYGHRGENPNANNWKQQHKGVRAVTGNMY